MNISSLVLLIIGGGLLGIIGQSIRTVVGISKMRVRNEEFELNRLLGSLMIGFTAGAGGILVMYFQTDGGDPNDMTFAMKDILLLLTIGYAGADFIEGFSRTYLSPLIKGQQSTPNQTTNNANPLIPVGHTHPVPGNTSHQLAGEDIEISFGHNAKPNAVSLYAIDVLKEILEKSGNKKALITSTARTPADQARVMYNLLRSRGVVYGKELYGVNGNKVIDVFIEADNAGRSRAEIIAEMEQKIWELGPSNVSKHCADPSKLVVVDISPKSISYQHEFVAQVKNDKRVSRFFQPPKDPAYHLEIPNMLEDDDIGVLA